MLAGNQMQLGPTQEISLSHAYCFVLQTAVTGQHYGARSIQKSISCMVVMLH